MPDEVSVPPPDIDEHGVDLTLVRWSLSLTVLERLEIVAGMAALVEQAGMVKPDEMLQSRDIAPDGEIVRPGAVAQPGEDEPG